MSAVSKDQSIILQVAGKIAADLTTKHEDINQTITNWSIAFDAVSDALLTTMGMNIATATQTEAMVVEAFGGTVVTQPAPVYAPTQPVATGGFQVRIKGQQHGPIPEWLHSECAKVGVTEVWDNRDGLSANPKRPWFKAVSGDKAFWAPRK
jgi:hypothetical protein